MDTPIQIRMGGYGPASTCFSRALQFIGDRLTAEFGPTVDVKYVWNIMDFGYRAEDILWLVENGILTLGYQSSSYLTDRIPELGMVDLPFLFADKDAARAAIDGALGNFLTRTIEARTNYRILGYFENGFRHISNRLREVRTPADLKGMRIRVLPSKVQARTPLANTVTYGAHKFHRFHTLTGHFYVSRPIFLNRTAFDAWPPDLQHVMRQAVTDAVVYQRELAIDEEREARTAIETEGCAIVEPTLGEHTAFAAAVLPLLDEARDTYGDALRLVAQR